ncbi:FAD-dependent oxidoreductase [bacterium]|nr:FAD-dependent oxidoreductase [bacterium]
MNEKIEILIVGGSAAGIAAAISARRYYPEKKITVIRKNEKVMIPCGIPYIFGTLGEIDKNIIPDTVLTTKNIDLLIDEVASIDKDKKVVNTKGGKTFDYEKMIIATGSLPLEPPIPGCELENAFVVQKEVPYLKKLQSTLSLAKDVVIIGGGFIGLEFADECKKRGIPNVTVVELLPKCLLFAADDEISTLIEKKLEERGIKVLNNRKVEKLLGDGKVESVQLDDGQTIKADAVIAGIGVIPNIELAANTGLDADRRLGVKVDEFMRTNNKDIFAVGDCAAKKCPLSGTPSNIRLASIATSEARIAAGNLFGVRRRNTSAIGIFCTMIGDLAVGSAGMTERIAKEMNIEVATGKFTSVNRHPGCIPGAEKIGVKLIFEKDTMVLIGGQVFGGPSIGEIINFIGALLQHKTRAYEISTFQVGTHPLLTASPIAYQIVNAAEIALTSK